MDNPTDQTEDTTSKKAKPLDVFIEEDKETDELPEAFYDLVTKAAQPVEEDS